MSLTTVLLRDEFSNTVAAGAVNGTTSDSGHTRTVADTESKLSISGGNLLISGGRASPDYGDPALNYGPVTKTAGIVFVFSVSFAVASQFCRFGYGTTVDYTGEGVLHFSNAGTIAVRVSPFPVFSSYSSSTQYQFFIAARAAGFYHFMKTASGHPLLMYATMVETGNKTPLITNYSQNSTFGHVRSAGYWLPVPIVSDSFTNNGVSDGGGHAETSGIGSGGGGVAWTQRVGTWTVSGGKAQATALSGGIAIATAASSTTDQFVGLDITRSAGEIGVVLRYTDASNYIRAVHNGTNLQVIKKVSGTDTTVINAAATYSAGKKIWIWTNGPAMRAYFNDALIGSATISDSVLQSGVVGIYTSDTGNTGDNFVAYAVGTGGEYAAAFDISIPANGSSAGVGDSNAGATRKRTANGSSAGATTQTGATSVRRNVNGSSAGVGIASGTGRANRLANGASAGSGNASGTIRVNRRVAGQSDGVSTATATSSRKRLISGASSGDSVAVVHNYTTEATIYSS